MKSTTSKNGAGTSTPWLEPDSSQPAAINSATVTVAPRVIAQVKKMLGNTLLLGTTDTTCGGLSIDLTWFMGRYPDLTQSIIAMFSVNYRPQPHHNFKLFIYNQEFSAQRVLPASPSAFAA